MENITQIKEIIYEQLLVNKVDIQFNSEIINDLGADSLDIIEITMAIEKEFSIEISDDDTSKIETVGDLMKVIDEKRK